MGENDRIPQIQKPDPVHSNTLIFRKMKVVPSALDAAWESVT